MELLKVFAISGKQVGGFKSDDDNNNHSGSNDCDFNDNNSCSNDYDINDNNSGSNVDNDSCRLCLKNLFVEQIYSLI